MTITFSVITRTLSAMSSTISVLEAIALKFMAIHDVYFKANLVSINWLGYTTQPLEIVPRIARVR